MHAVLPQLQAANQQMLRPKLSRDGALESGDHLPAEDWLLSRVSSGRKEDRKSVLAAGSQGALLSGKFGLAKTSLIPRPKVDSLLGLFVTTPRRFASRMSSATACRSALCSCWGRLSLSLTRGRICIADDIDDLHTSQPVGHPHTHMA